MQNRSALPFEMTDRIAFIEEEGSEESFRPSSAENHFALCQSM